MKVVILAGGRGVRYDADKPKALVRIGNKPIIHHLMDIYKQQGFNDFIFCLGWRREDIVNYLSSINNDYNITCVDTEQDSHTAKRLKLIESYIPKEDENFFCTYADGLANVDLAKLQVRHLTHKKLATLTAVKPNSQFGILIFDECENIVRFQEKPKMRDYISGGFFIFNKKIFNYIDLDKNEELEKDILTKLANSGELGSYKHEGFWETLNTVKDEIRLNELYRQRTLYNEKMDWLRI